MSDADYRQPFYRAYVSGHQGEVLEHRSQSNLEQDVLQHLPANRKAAILDVGCGQGQLIRLIERDGFANVSGIDLSAEQVALARKLGTERVVERDLFELAAAEPGTYDVVIAIDVVEHFDRADVQRAFQAFSDLLKPGGRFILRTPNGVSPYAGRILFSDLTHGVIYTETSLQQVGHVTGFASFSAYPVPPAGTSAKAKVRRALWTLVELWFKAPLVIETGQLRGHIVTQNLIGVGIKAG
jgi:2-polyprenyl-3-methyl-5-hydroxy-6-metoxy-1,4-benzoquinol methylase